MSGARRRETINLSLGPTANAVTSHLLNLEGLAVTSAAADDSLPVCEPVVTHRRDNANQVWVPRVLMVDESHNLHRTTNCHQESASNRQELAAHTTTEAAASSWNGAVKEFDVQNFSLDDFHSVENVVANLSYNSNPNTTVSDAAKPWLSSWQQTANQLAYAPYSRYRIPDLDSALTSTVPPADNARHVNWGDFGEEPEDEQERAAREERQRRSQQRQWDEERNQYEETMSSIWNNRGSRQSNGAEASREAEDTAIPLESDLEGLTWMDYWMPPHPSPLSQCTYGLPSTSSSLEAPPLHSFNVTNSSASSKIVLDDVWEKIRLQLERADSCQGFTILTEGCGIYAGITDWLLQELQQECRAASRWVFHVAADDDSSLQKENDENVALSRSTELARAQAKFRDSMQRGLAMASLVDHSHVLIPLMLPSKSEKSLFRASAELAVALETATLPYRCRSSSAASLLGWNSMSGYEEGASPSGMSLADYLSTLQPSPRYSLLELDTVMAEDNRKRVGRALAMGTSVERDPRMRRPPSSLGNDYPGAWLLDTQFGSSSTTPTPSSGLLTSLSPGHVAKQDRALHHHYGLSTCMRRGQSLDSPMLSNNQHYLTCLMEGMGIRYRPETAFGLVTNQNLAQLTTTGHRYGAGSYWQYLLGSGTGMPVVSVLGNSTRMYPHLHTIAGELKNTLKSSKTKGFYQREVTNGTLPEVDDCDEALEQCLDLRDVYEPPNGSGLDTGDEEHYFE